MAPRRSKEPKDRKVTARFSLEEYHALIAEAQRRGQPVSTLLHEAVVLAVDEILEKLSRERS